MLSVLPPLSGTAPIRTLFRLVLVFNLALVLDTFSTIAVSSLATSTSSNPTSGLSPNICLFTRYISPISPSLPFILSDQVKDWMVASSLASNIFLLKL